MSALLLVLAALLPLAHGETGSFQVIEASPASDLSVRYVVELTYTNDRDPVPDAEVVLTATGPDGGTVGPVPMTGGADGRYEATVTFPGAGVWGVRIASETPVAVVEQTSTVGVASTTASPTTTTTEAERSSTTAGSATEDDDEGGGGVRPGTVIAVGIAAVAIAFVLRRQRDRQRAGL
jgi:hypothetical protein